MKLRLFRTYLPNATVGVLVGDGLLLATLERPWLENRQGVSCVPVGDYELEPHSGTLFADVWALVGPGVSHWPTPEENDREAILIHPANGLGALRGCIAPGLQLDFTAGQPKVLASGRAVERLRMALERSSRHQLAIRGGPFQW